MWWERAFDHFPLHPAIRSAAGEKKIQLFVCISQQLCNPTRLLRSKSHSIQGELIPGKRVQDCSLKSYRNKKGDPITGLPHHICFGPDPEQSWKQVSLNKHRDTNKKYRKESNSIGINWFTEENHSQFPCSPPKKNLLAKGIWAITWACGSALSCDLKMLSLLQGAALIASHFNGCPAWSYWAQ